MDATRTKPCLWLVWLKISMLGQVQMANSPRLQANLNHNSWDRPLFPTLMGTSCLLLIIWMITKKKKKVGEGVVKLGKILFSRLLAVSCWGQYGKLWNMSLEKPVKLNMHTVRSEGGSSYLCISVFQWQGYLRDSNCIYSVICWLFAFAFPLLTLDGFD